MTATRSSLLHRVCDPADAKSWSEFNTLYRPFLVRYAIQRGLDPHSAEDVTQQCLAAVAANISRFEKKRGFRSWLRGMVDHKVADYLTAQRRQIRGGNDKARDAADASPGPSDVWEREWNHALLQLLIADLQKSFAEHTLRAFEMYVLHGVPVEDIVRLTGLKAGQIYVAKSRVIAHIRKHCGELIECLYGVWP